MQNSNITMPQLNDINNTFRRYVGIFLNYWWVFLILPAILGIGTYFYSSSQDTMYEAKSTLLVEQRRTGGVAGVSDFTLSEDLARMYMKQILSTPFISRVAEEPDVKYNVDELKLMLTADAHINPPTLDVIIRNSDKTEAADVANKIATTFINYTVELRLGEIAKIQTAALSQGLPNVQELVASNFTTLDSLSLLEPAAPPKFPAFPRTKRNTAIGVMLGFLLATFLSVLLSSITSTIKDVENIYNQFGVPTLGNIFRWGSQNDQDEVLTHTDPSSPYSEAFRHIRANFQFATANKQPPLFLITSPGPGEGKSTIISNLGASLAQNGKKVVILDADLRKPTIHRRFNLKKREPGLSTFLSDKDLTPSEIIMNPGIPNLDIIPSGPVPPNPSELLGTERMKNLCDDLHSKLNYDYVLLDSPPILVVADGSVLASIATAGILIVDGFSTKIGSLQSAVNTLNGTAIETLGIIVNKLKNSRFSYGYRYPYYYNYYYYQSYYQYNEAGEKTKKQEKRSTKSTIKKLFRWSK